MDTPIQLRCLRVASQIEMVIPSGSPWKCSISYVTKEDEMWLTFKHPEHEHIIFTFACYMMSAESESDDFVDGALAVMKERHWKVDWNLELKKLLSEGA